MKKNKGFTLVELIVVIAIVAISVGLVSMSISSVSAYRAKKCAAEINAMLSECKVNTMSRGAGVSLKLRCEDGEVFAQLSGQGEESLGGGLTLSYTVTGDDTKVAVGTEGILIAFERSTGAFKTLYEAGNTTGFADGDGKYCTALVVGGAREIAIKLVPTTGHHEIG